MEIRRRFQLYMSHFQFEGEVDWESFGRIHFKLFIKARKEGHQGTMEDASTEEVVVKKRCRYKSCFDEKRANDLIVT